MESVISSTLLGCINSYSLKLGVIELLQDQLNIEVLDLGVPAFPFAGVCGHKHGIYLPTYLPTYLCACCPPPVQGGTMEALIPTPHIWSKNSHGFSCSFWPLSFYLKGEHPSSAWLCE